MLSEISNKRIIIYHPMQQHSYRMAEALVKQDLLYRYITTVYYDSSKLIFKLLGKVLGENNLSRMQGKQNNSIKPYVVTFSQFLGLLFLLLARIDKKDFLKSNLQNLIVMKMGKETGKFVIKNKIDIIICYDTWSYGLIKYLKKKSSNAKIILDMSGIPAANISKILEQQELVINPRYKSKMKIFDKMFNHKQLKKYNYEIRYADYYFTPSNFAKSNILEFGINENRIFVNEYGSNMPSKDKCKSRVNQPITFLYLGQVSVAKGFHLLLDAMSELYGEFKVIVAGSPGLFFNELKSTKSIEYKGFLPHSELLKVFQESDVFITPSIFDSFSFSLTEAMSMGIPVISTENVGASQFIENGISGFIVKSMDSDAIKTKMQWFINNPTKIVEMGENARDAIKANTWELYNQRVCKSLKIIMEEENECNNHFKF